MGIPRFFRVVSKTILFNQLHTITVNSTFNTDNLYLDANSIVHYAAQRVCGYGNFKQPSYKYQGQDLFTSIFKETCYYIDFLVSRIVIPKKCLFIAFDGVCPLLKQQQQMRRRYRKSEENDSQFDTNLITPGTEFMDALNQYMHWFLRMKLHSNNWSFKVVYSDCDVPGEGEHKIMNYIRKMPIAEKHCIYGLDADLIVLSTILNRDIHLIRENVFTSFSKFEFHLVDIQLFREKLLTYMRTDLIEENGKKIRNNLKDEQFYLDFAILTFLLGNDFVGAIPILDDLEWSLPLLMRSYRKVQKPLYDNNSINFTNLKMVLKHMKNDYIQKLNNESKIRYKYPNTILLHGIEHVYNPVTKKAKAILNIRKYRKLYYKKYSPSGEDYLDLLHWIADYYINGFTSNKGDWLYNTVMLHPPDLLTLIKYKSEYKNIQKTSQCNSVENLITCVLPSDYILPLALKKYHIKRKTGEIERIGTNVEWTGHMILEPITVEEATRVLPKIRDDSCDVLMYHDDTIRYRYNNKFGYIDNCRTRTAIYK